MTGGALAGVLLLSGAGCSSDAAPEPSPLPTESPTLSESAPPSAPALPPEAEGTSAKAAKTFVRHWIATLNHAAVHSDDAPIRELSSGQCAACAAIADLIESVSENGGHIAGDGWEIRRLKVVSKQRSTLVVDALVRVHPQVAIPSAGAEKEKYSGGRRVKTFWLVSGSRGWQVQRLDQPS